MNNEMSSKTKNVTYYVEGPDWVQTVSLDTNAFDTEEVQIIEAGTRAIEQEMEKTDNFNIGAMLVIRKSKKAKTEKFVNAYLCLNNAAQYSLAEDLRKNYKAQTGNDLAVDDMGMSEWDK
jgi:hypothetical protein